MKDIQQPHQLSLRPGVFQPANPGLQGVFLHLPEDRLVLAAHLVQAVLGAVLQVEAVPAEAGRYIFYMNKILYFNARF